MTWWDPLLLGKRPDDARGLRREELISRDANPIDVAADRAAYDRGASAVQPCRPRAAWRRLRVLTATELAEAPEGKADQITIEDAGFGVIRPSGKRFGTLVHAVLATLPMQASSDEVQRACRAAREVVRRPRR